LPLDAEQKINPMPRCCSPSSAMRRSTADVVLVLFAKREFKPHSKQIASVAN
jgi:hypothetical protein